MRTRRGMPGLFVAVGVLCAGLWVTAFSLDATRIQASVPASVTPPPPYLAYQVYGGHIITDSTMPPVLPNGQADYAQIYAEHNLCALLSNHQIDEVWIWAGNGDGVTKGHMWEWTTSGDDWSGDAPDCGQVATTMTFNYLREVDVALESFNHRLEGVLGHYFTCDISTATWPWAGSTTLPYSRCGSLLSNRYGFVARPFAENDQIGGCGDAHHPPNILDNRDYIYDDPTTVQTICPSWSQDGSAVTTTLNCNAWGCTHWGFHMWWMQNMPGLNNINKTREGNAHPNWWSYLFGVPSPKFQVYLPVIVASQTRFSVATIQPSRLTAEPKAEYATAPGMEPVAPDGSKPGGLHSPIASAAASALTTRTVYVIYYPGYGGTPRIDINLQNNELIGLLKEATIYHGYNYDPFRGTFLGQDGQSYAGENCTAGNRPDNIHIHLDGIRTDVQAIRYQVEDGVGGGLWVTPCTSNWLLHVITNTMGQADLYFKPFRDAPDGTSYLVTIGYSDGSSRSINVIGSRVQPLVTAFLEQPGDNFADVKRKK